MLLELCGCVLLLNSVVSQPRIVEQDQDNKLFDYFPKWDNLDSRPLPFWYDDAKIGIFIHWGVYSVPSFGSEWFWSNWHGNSSQYTEFMNKNYPPGFKYQDFGRDFTAEFFEPEKWANIFKRSGAQYVVLTSKHHEGFTLFPSDYTFGWNAMDIGPHRDLVGELASAVRAVNLHFGLYYSLYEWFNPLYLRDKANNFSTNDFVTEKMLPELKALITQYKPEVVWADGDWEATDVYWLSKVFLAWLYNESPVKKTVVVNDRWGKDMPCHHGGYYTCQDRYNPGVLQDHKWENAMTLDKKSWGFRRNADIAEYMTIEELLTTLAMTVSCRGNLLVNVGPSKDGTISPIFEERLLQLGEWLGYNGEAIYGSDPWLPHQNETNVRVWYTLKQYTVYAICLDWPQNGTLILENGAQMFHTGVTTVTMLGTGTAKIWWTFTENLKKVHIIFPDKSTVPVQWAWVLKIT